MNLSPSFSNYQVTNLVSSVPPTSSFPLLPLDGFEVYLRHHIIVLNHLRNGYINSYLSKYILDNKYL